MLTGALRNEIDKLWETFWTGGISNPLTVIEQITYLLFLRRMDEVQTLKENKANRTGKPITEPIYTAEEKPLRWSAFKNKGPETMYSLFTRATVNEMTVFDKMKAVGAKGSGFSRFMKGATFMIPTAKLLDKVVQMIDAIDMHDRDTKGDLYEYLLSKIQSAGQNGQFRTPRHIIRLMVDMVKPTPEDTICDPAAGTMGFLIGTSDYMHDHYQDEFHKDEFLKHYQSDMFSGMEFDATMMRIGSMNLMLHGINNPQLLMQDSLSEASGHLQDQYSIILANPPFKGSLDYDAVDQSILNVVKSKKTELLFLGLMLRMLRVGGRAAVIVPDGVLFGSSKAHKQIRREIVEGHQLNAVISLPSGVFKPYAGVSTAILIFTKTNSGGTDYVWFYDMKNDGYSMDDKRSSVDENDIPDILKRWENMEDENDRARTEKSFMVSFKEIEENNWNLSVNQYKEIVYEEIDYDSPSKIIADIRQIDKERMNELKRLEQLIHN